ncbi:amidase family protein [Carex rostrata]
MPSPIQNPRLLLTSTRIPLSLSSKTPCTHRCLASLPSLSPQTLAPQSTTSSILSIRESLLSGRKKAVEIAAEYLDRIRLTEPQLKSFIHLSDSVLKDALELDRKVENGEVVGPLSGVLVGVKDNLCTVDMPSTGGSRILDGYRPAFDATAVRKLREAGAIIVGKTNMDEFGMGSTTEGSGFHVTKNPWDTSRVPGGSSGGSAAAVSARQCVASLGSDTGGSVRQPASFCGVVGLKPTYGRVSRFGLMAYASSLDVVGVFGSSVMDTAIVLSAIAGHDRLDATSSSHEVPDYSSEMVSLDQLDSKPLKGLKIGVIKETLGDGIEAGVVSSIKAASSHLEQLGSIVGEVSLPSFDLGLPAYYILASSEASSNLARYDSVRYGQQADADDLSLLYGDSRAKGLGHEVKMRILMGTYALSAGYYDAYYKRAQQVRTLVQKSFKDALDQYDILISPAAPSAAYKIGEKTNDPLAMYAGDIMTVNVNLAGLPSLVVPCGFVEGGASGLPVGLQMISSSFSEDKLLRVGHVFEQSLQGYNFVPPVLSEN